MVEFAEANDISETEMMSFDVTALFTNVPLDLTLDFISRKIDENLITIPIPKEAFLNLIRLCTENNVFQFEGDYYRQRFGVAMGSPLSPVLANIFMEMFETELLTSLTGRPLLWVRYVDDIFAVCPNDSDSNLFLSQLNNLVDSIKFTVEKEQESSLPFLDTTVHRRNGSFRFAVYRKPTHSGQYLHYFSWHEKGIKRSVVFSLLLRAYRICDPEFLQQEICTIFKLFHKLAYPKYFLEKIDSDVRRSYYGETREGQLLSVSPPFLYHIQNLAGELFDQS